MSLSDMHAELVEMSEKYPEGLGYEEFLKEDPSPELARYVEKLGWDRAVDDMFMPKKKSAWS